MVVFLDFPFWIRFAHFLNLIFITLLILSGIESIGTRKMPVDDWDLSLEATIRNNA